MIKAAGHSTAYDAYSLGERHSRALRAKQFSAENLKSQQQENSDKSQRRQPNAVSGNEQTPPFALRAPDVSKQQRTAKPQSDSDQPPSTQLPRKREPNKRVDPSLVQQRADDSIRGKFVGSSDFSNMSRQAIQAYKDNYEQETQSYTKSVLGIDVFA